MLREYDEKPFDPEAHVERPKHHVYLNNPRRMRRNEAKPGITDLDTLTQLVEWDLEAMGVDSRKARDISSVNQEVKSAARKFEDAVDSVLLDYIQRNIGKFDRSGNGVLERDADEFAILQALADTGGGASFLYYMEHEGHGIGTWDGRWDKIFRNDNTLKELSTLVKRNTAKEYQALNTAIQNNAFELMQEHGIEMSENPRRRAKKSSSTRFYAQPYNPTATGFYFEDMKQFEAGMKKLRRNGVEEVEIEFIDGDEGDGQLFGALKLGQSQIGRWFEDIEPLDENQKAGLYAMFALTGESDLDEALEKLERENPVVFRGTVKEYAEDYLESAGMLDNATEKLAEEKAKNKRRRPHSPPVGEYEQFLNSYFDYELWGQALRNDMETAGSEEEQSRYDGMSDQEIGEQSVDDLGWNGIGDENIKEYFDAEKFARDLELGGDVTEFQFAGSSWILDNHI